VEPATRSGTYYRAFKPEWPDPLATTPSRLQGGRWNPPGEFGVLYLNRTIEVAAANVRARHIGRAIGLFDLQPERRPHLLQVHIPRSTCLDLVSPSGVAALGLPATYPFAVGHETCRPIGRRAYATGRFRGIACRSAAECTSKDWLGEELAWFDTAPSPQENDARRPFATWYPDVAP